MCDTTIASELVKFNTEKNVFNFDMEAAWKIVQEGNKSQEITVEMLIV